VPDERSCHPTDCATDIEDTFIALQGGLALENFQEFLSDGLEFARTGALHEEGGWQRWVEKTCKQRGFPKKGPLTQQRS